MYLSMIIKSRILVQCVNTQEAGLSALGHLYLDIMSGTPAVRSQNDPYKHLYKSQQDTTTF
jgi:hypothetical protein